MRTPSGWRDRGARTAAPREQWRRRTVRITALLLAVYLGGAVAVVLWLERIMEDAAWDLMRSTVRMMSAGISSAVQEPLIEALREDGSGAALEEVLASLVTESDVVHGAVLVTAQGDRPVEAGELPPGMVLPEPAALFARDLRIRIEARPARSLSGGIFLVDLPLVDDGAAVAYLRLNLVSRPLAELYRNAYLTLLFVMASGVAVIGLLAMLLHLQYANRDRWLHGALTEMLGEGGPSAPQRRDTTVAAMGRLRELVTTERDQLEEARGKLDRVGRVLDLGVVVVDGGDRVELLGRHAAQLLGDEKLAARFRGPVDELLPGSGELVARCRASGRPVDADLRSSVDGRWLRVVAAASADPGPESSVMLRIQDRDEVLALESDLVEAARLRSLARLYMGITHDLKAPLNAIVLNLATLRMSLEKEEGGTRDPRRYSERLELIEGELGRLQRAMESLLAHTVPRQDDFAEFDLVALVGDLERLLLAQARQQQVKVRVTSNVERVVVAGRPDRIKQALLNLLVNSMEAMPEGGELGIEVTADRDAVALTVSDTGDGIPEDVRERVFELHVTTKATGTGIGLYLARRLVEDAGGALELVSTGPGGTTFVARLPAVAGEG